MPFAALAQEAAIAKDKEKNTAPASSRAQRKKAKQKWKEGRLAERDQAKAVKDYHKHLQSKDTKKRMRQEKKRSERLKTNKKESSIVRWFKYKHH